MALSKRKEQLYLNYFATPLGKMASLSDHHHLYFLKFIDNDFEGNELIKVQSKYQNKFLKQPTKISELIETEVHSYFLNSKFIFTTPTKFFGTSFQEQIWKELVSVNSGQTTTYQKLALKVNRLKSQRAIGNCVGQNCLAIIIPCHRVILSNGQLGGYNGGIVRKQWLLKHEQIK
ncbi:methylated-DNA--[protein]-cysteine S-methyltransferase [Mesoplasma seiffertii]|uniref:methylated-DNA--[protein]-cysteine S-methyltransferase n=1 Tax=Mesoplasma seiffertii TaxID=28224 RepID=UPI00055DB0E3|nr:methylated-DNA--[protein]-cysteine S-methyltransferase [Mesoplasma seiffertii]